LNAASPQQENWRIERQKAGGNAGFFVCVSCGMSAALPAGQLERQ
jgi:hypothetical protein